MRYVNVPQEVPVDQVLREQGVPKRVVFSIEYRRKGDTCGGGYWEILVVLASGTRLEETDKHPIQVLKKALKRYDDTEAHLAGVAKEAVAFGGVGSAETQQYLDEGDAVCHMTLEWEA